MDYFILVLVHVLLFVYWLGGDLGVFYSSFVVADSKTPVAGRSAAARILIAVDQVPRYCLILMLPIGLALAGKLGLVSFDPFAWLAIGVATLAWIALVTAIHVRHGDALAQALTKIDYAVRIALVATLLGIGGASLFGNGPIAANWLAAKMMLLGVTVLCGLGIRQVFKPFLGAFQALVSSGSTPEIEETIRSSLGRTRPLVILIWISLIAAAWCGIAKPTF